MESQTQGALAILRLDQVRARTGFSRSSIYNLMAAGDFPRKVALGPRSVGWVESEVEAWIAARIAASRPELEAA